MELDKNRIKSIANKHGIKVSFGSNKPGFLSESNKRLYTFSDLDKIIDKTLLWGMKNDKDNWFSSSPYNFDYYCTDHSYKAFK